MESPCLCLLWWFNDRFVGRQRLGPETVQLGTMRSQPGTIELVNALISNRPIFHQPCVFQHPEMLRHRRLTDKNGTSQVADSLGGLCQALEDCTPGRVA